MAKARILWDVMEEHLDEAAFLFTQWESGLYSPRMTLQRLATTVEERLLSHLDALVLAGPEGAEWLTKRLSSTSTGVVFAAASALLSPELEGYSAAVVARLVRAEEAARLALKQALRLSTAHSTVSLLQTLLQNTSGVVQAIAIELLAERGAIGADTVAAALRSDSSHLNTAGLIATRRLALSGLDQEITALLTAHSAGVRLQALTSGMVLGLKSAEQACLSSAEWYASPEALELLARAGHPDAISLLRDSLRVPELAEGALKSLGMSGFAESADACLGALENPAIHALAAEAFALITGVDYERLGAIISQPELPQEEDDTDWERLPSFEPLRPEAELPKVNPDIVADWWKSKRGTSAAGTRMVHGRPFSASGFETALAEASLYRHHLLARMLESASRGRCQLRTQTLCRVQALEIGSGLGGWQ